MTYFDIKKRIEALKDSRYITDCAYLQFEKEVKTPFIVYYAENESHGGADDENVIKTQAVTIELYTDKRDFDLESRVDGLFFDTAFEKLCTYIEAEHMHMTAYSFEITNFIN